MLAIASELLLCAERPRIGLFIGEGDTRFSLNTYQTQMLQSYIDPNQNALKYWPSLLVNLSSNHQNDKLKLDWSI